MNAETFAISSRFCGPPGSGNGGYVCGRIAKLLGEQCVVLGWRIGIEGRKRYAGSAVFNGAGQPVAWSRATWIEVPESAFANN